MNKPTKLKPEMIVIYFDGQTLLDKTSVVSVDKANGTAKLANGVILNREPIKKGYYKRAGVRSDAKAWLSDPTSEAMYKAYSNKAKIKKMVPDLLKKLESKSVLADVDIAWVNELYKTLNTFMEV